MGLDIRYSAVKPWPGDDADEQAIEHWYEDSDGGFRAGSYSGYNRWREELCRMAHGCEPHEVWDSPEKYDAFVEQINFTDCDGFHDAGTAAKLAKDYKKYRDRAVRHAERLEYGEEWFLRLYDEWAKAYETAAKGGSVLYA